MKRVKTIMIFVLLSLSFAVVAETEAPIEIEVYRSPKCGCCSKWIAHLEDNNFKVKDFVSNDVQTKRMKWVFQKTWPPVIPHWLMAMSLKAMCRQ